MKRITSYFVLFILTLFILSSCGKEYSIEGGGGASSSVGALSKDAFGGCLPINVQGVYKKDLVLGAGNFVEVQVVVTTPGTYVISSDTVNGYYFRATGVFNLPGTNTIRLIGTGTPIALGTNAFIASYGGTECFFEVTVLAGTTGGGGSSDILEARIDGLPAQFNQNPSALLVTVLGFQSLSITGVTAGAQNLALSITKTNSSPITAGTYTVNQFITGNVINCIYRETGTNIFLAQTNPTAIQIPAFTIIITSITATRVIGTFSGPVKDNNGAGPGVKTFTQGTFNVPIM
jgi:hypothetical protein